MLSSVSLKNLILEVFFLGLLLMITHYTVPASCSDACLSVTDLPPSGSTTDPRALTPWVASIFKRNSTNDTWAYHCGATVTSTYTVITAASCVSTIEQKNYNAIHYKYDNLRVVVGLLTSDYYAPRDNHTQESEIGMIREHQTPRATTNSGYEQNYLRSTNLAGIRLKTPFVYSDFVKSVCLVEVPNTIEEIITLAPGQRGLISGFDINPVNDGSTLVTSLKSFNLEFTDPVSCAKKYPSSYKDVVCGKTLETSSLPCFMNGAGLIVSTDGSDTGVGKLYLMGVYVGNTGTISKSSPYPINSILDKNTSCNNNNDVAFFVKHGQHYRWAISHAYCSEELLQCQSDNCRPLSELCDGTKIVKMGLMNLHKFVQIKNNAFVL